MKRFAAACAAVFLCCSVLPLRVRAAGPATSASSAILIDAASGRVLYEQNAHERRLIASITKLMTALVAVESASDLERPIEIRPEWTGIEGSSMYLRAGEQLTLKELLYGLLLASGNDAAVAIAGACAGDVETFVDWMNEKAGELGMKNTHFANPNGLNDDQHYSTAADMAQLARVVMENQDLETIVGTKSITLAGGTQTRPGVRWCPVPRGMGRGSLPLPSMIPMTGRITPLYLTTALKTIRLVFWPWRGGR